MIKSLLYCLAGALIISGCVSTKPSASKTAESYKEDLSHLRPEIEAPKVFAMGELEENTPEYYSSITPSFDVTQGLNTILDSIDILRSNRRYIDGYTIQVYYGGNREEAYLTRGKIYSLIPQAKPVLNYDQVNFTVKIGKYYSSLEAQKLYLQIKKKFPNATIMPERIYIR